MKLGSLRKWDKLRDQIQVGSTSAQVKQRVNYHSLVGGGLKGAKLRPWNPLGWPEIHHQVVVVVVLL